METVFLPGNIRQRLFDLMKHNNVSQTELARKIGCNDSLLSRFLSEKTDKLGDENIIRIAIPKGKEASFERNRNLFYVCCSRAKKRLFLFVTVPTDYEFKAFLMSLIGKDNIYTYSQFLEMER